MMSNRRRNPARDANEPEIVAALQAHGWTVERLNGRGVPDLLLGKNGVNVLQEVKRPPGPRGGTKGRELNADQLRWHAAWNGQACIVRTAEEAVDAAERELRLRFYVAAD